LGIDISEVAIRKATRFSDSSTVYVRADMEIFEPHQMFDVILFNESLYYAKAPNQLVARFADFLNFDGLIVISVFATVENEKLLDSLGAPFFMKEQATSSNERGVWYCRIYAKAAV
jgi:SAM-dependent methyltransferase